jgi:hypothetical protein
LGLVSSATVRQACGMKPRSLALLAVLSVSAACESRLSVTVQGVLLPECDSPAQAPAAPVVAILAEPTVPDEQLPLPSGAVQLAIERSVPWARVETLLAILERKQIEPILLVGQTYRVRRFFLNDKFSGPADFTITGDTKGKFCVQTASLPQAYCVQGAGRHIHRAFVRETVREVVKKWEMHKVEAYVDPAMDWADVIRLVDGARSCCGVDSGVRVRVATAAPLGDDAEQGNPALLEVARQAERAAGAQGEDEGAAPLEQAAAPDVEKAAGTPPAAAPPSSP